MVAAFAPSTGCEKERHAKVKTTWLVRKSDFRTETADSWRRNPRGGLAAHCRRDTLFARHDRQPTRGSPTPARSTDGVSMFWLRDGIRRSRRLESFVSRELLQLGADRRTSHQDQQGAHASRGQRVSGHRSVSQGKAQNPAWSSRELLRQDSRRVLPNRNRERDHHRRSRARTAEMWTDQKALMNR